MLGSIGFVTKILAEVLDFIHLKAKDIHFHISSNKMPILLNKNCVHHFSAERATHTEVAQYTILIQQESCHSFPHGARHTNTH